MKKVYQLSYAQGRKTAAQYFLTEEKAKECFEAYRQQGAKRLDLKEIEVPSCILKAGALITESKVSPSLLGHTVHYNDCGQIIKATVIRVCTTYPNVGLTIKPLEPSKHYFTDPFEPITFGVRAPFSYDATFVE